MPTLAELAGVRCPGKIDGISILPVLTGSGQHMFRRFMYWEKLARRYADFEQAVRYGKWKALRAEAEQSLELFDLEKDPGEKIDVASRNQEIVSSIENYLKTARTDSPFWTME